MKKILMIDDDKVSLSAAKAVLKDDYKIIAVLDGMQGIKYLESNTCDLILLDINMPGINGFDTLTEIRKREENANIPVIFLTSDTDAETETKCFEYGARDFIAKPFVSGVIRSRVNRILELEDYHASLEKELTEKTQEMDIIKSKSYTDALTGLWNREYTEKHVNELLSAGVQGSLMMIDLDNFKAINDNYGHQAGDKVLLLFADTLREYAEDKDVVCRIGGDEFILFLNGKTERDEISNIAQNIIISLNSKIKSLKYDVKTSVSIGISISGVDGTDFAKLYNCGDKALYYVKNNGKNSFRFFSDNTMEQKQRALKNADLTYLAEILSRSDSGNGAYMLDFENFHHIYNFLKRFVEREDKKLVSVLFNVVSATDGVEVSQEDAELALDFLDKSILTSLRRVDISTRYSSVQTIVVLVDVDIEHAGPVVDRIIETFNNIYTGNKVKLQYSLAKIKSRKEQ